MATKTVWRFADWVLKLDTSGTGPIFEMECVSCDATSGAADTPDGPQNWALSHAGRTGHVVFRALHTSFFRASMTEDAR